MIQCDNLMKVFKSYQKPPGLMGSLKSLVSREVIENVAVHDFSVSVAPGEIVALLGPNGSGKTTLMKMFTGIIARSSGELLVCGHNPEDRQKAFRKKIALVMGQKCQLWWDIPAMDSFRLIQRYYEIETLSFKRRMEELVEYLNVKDILHIHVRKLSLGERMKLELMASLLHEPEIIFLDEPTIGLDLLAQEKIRDFIKQYHKEHRCTIILTSHYMADVEALCKRLVLMFNGEKYFDGPLSEFARVLHKKKNVHFQFDCPQLPQDRNDAFWNLYRPIWNDKCTQVEVMLEAKELREVSRHVLSEYPISDFSTEKVSIEQVLKEIIKTPSLLRNEK